ELRSHMHEPGTAIKSDRDAAAADRPQIAEWQAQIREIHSALAIVGDSQHQLRDLIQELDSAIGEVRNEALHVAELQRMEEQRLRRQGMELQELFEALRQQFTEVAARSQRVDDVRRQLIERIEAVEEQIGMVHQGEQTTDIDLERIEKLATEQYLTQQERLETIRLQVEAQLVEMREIADQRMDRYLGRFTGI